MEGMAQATREIMWNISHAWLIYPLFIISLVFLVRGVNKRILFWKKGKSDNECFSDLIKRFRFMIMEVFNQERVNMFEFPAFFHSCFFYSFLILFGTTTVVALDYDFGTSLFTGIIYIVLSLGADIAGGLILIGIAAALWRRYVMKPKTIETSFKEDTWALILLALIVITGFIAEALRISVTGDVWQSVSPVGKIIAVILYSDLDPDKGASRHAFVWWIHTLLAFGWIASIPKTKFFHILTLPANAFLSKMKPAGELERVDLEELMEDENFDPEDFTFGIDTTNDFTWKHRMEFDTCVSCGRCEEVCPAFSANQPLSPKYFISSIKDLIIANDNKVITGDSGLEIVENAFDENYLWFCRTCYGCTGVCPAFINHVDRIIDIRRNEVVMKGRVPNEANRTLKTIQSLGNPFASQSERVEWVESLDVKIVGPGESCDVLYWIGCLTTFDPTKHKIATDLIHILKKCDIDVGILGGAEMCCGDPCRVFGDEHNYQMAVKPQIEELNNRTFNTLLVTCPHCYNTLENEHPQFGGKYNVVHYSEFLLGLIREGKIKFDSSYKKSLTYHDPCYLGRYQKVFDDPRQVLNNVYGSSIIEMPKNRERSFCCGGGGGHFWMDIKEGERINSMRVLQAKEAGAQTIATACPYCMQMLDDGIKINNLDEEMAVEDLAGLILKVMKK